MTRRICALVYAGSQVYGDRKSWDVRIIDQVVLNFAVALGLGLLIGAERERRKGTGPTRSPAGIRTFAVASLAGAISFFIGGQLLFAITIAGVIALVTVAYWRARDADPGLTTEIALVVTTALGGLSMQNPALAAGLGVILAILLAARASLHRFVRSAITEGEIKDALTLAAATLVVLPLLPDRQMGPFGALNPQSIWLLVILVMVIGALGHVAVRFLGVRQGLALAGLASGFISSTATIGAMGARAVKSVNALPSAVAAAVLSSVATIIELILILAATNLATLKAMTVSLICAGAAAVVYGVIFTLRAVRASSDRESERGSAFSLKTTFIFAFTLACVLIIAAALREWFGKTGAIVAAGLAGFIDTHSAAISIASLVSAGKMSGDDAVFPILAALTTNMISKTIVASAAGGRLFAARVIPGLILIILAAWAGAYASS